jgi:hypothetical protein
MSARRAGERLSMADVAKIAEPTTIANVALTVTRGVTAGWIAGIPQVLVRRPGDIS